MISTNTLMSSDGSCYKLHSTDATTDSAVVVLIHGLGLDQNMWHWQLEALTQNYRVLTYDLTGMGKSSPPTQTPDLTMFSNQLVTLLDELKLDKVAVAGFSLGGMIARRFAMDYPHRLSALAILHSAYKRDADAHNAIQSRVYQAQREGPQATVEAAISRWFTTPFQNANPDIMNWIRTTILANDKTIYPKNYQVLVDGVNELAAPDPPILCPTFVMTAEQDYGNSPEMSHAIASEIKDSVKIILPALRHMAMVEAPELFNQHLMDFFSRLPALQVKA